MQDSVQLPCAGFETGIPGENRQNAQCIRIPVKNGRYAIRVVIKAQRDVPEALLFANHRRLIWRGSLAENEKRTVTASVAVHPFMRETKVMAGENLELALVGDDAQITDVTFEAAAVPAVLMMGDSTVTDQGAFSPFAPGASYGGWGQILPVFLRENACVMNFAKSGLTVETFRIEGHDALLKRQLLPGDIVLIQFGHNDQKRVHLLAGEGYAQALCRYMDELRALKARPVLVTPLARNSWFSESEYNDLLLPYADACRDIAREKGVPLIDLHAFMRGEIIRYGREAMKPLFHIGDYTHTNDFGAHLAARFIAAQLREQGILSTRDDADWTPQGPYDVPANDQGDESLTPTGLEALYQAYETNEPHALLTRGEAVELICRTCALFATNEHTVIAQDVPADAPFAEDVRCAAQSRLLPEDMMQCFCAKKPVTVQEFTEMIRSAYAMRCTDELAALHEIKPLTRARAAAFCRNIQI